MRSRKPEVKMQLTERNYRYAALQSIARNTLIALRLKPALVQRKDIGFVIDHEDSRHPWITSFDQASSILP